MKQLLALNAGEKYTIVRYGEMGFVFAVQLIVNAFEVKPYAQYRESVYLIFRKKGARKASAMRFFPNDDYLVYSGWVEVNTSMFVSISVSASGMTCRTSLLSCDREYLHIAKRSVPAAPIFEKITPLPNADTATISKE
jgi:hypothetical protein